MELSGRAGVRDVRTAEVVGSKKKSLKSLTRNTGKQQNVSRFKLLEENGKDATM